MKPFGIVTDRGQMVSQSAIDRYALKSADESDSRSLPHDAFSKATGAERLVQPLYNPEKLATLLEGNTFHARCVSVKARDTAGLGYMLTPVPDQPEAGEDDLDAFVHAGRLPITDTLYRAEYDRIAVSYGTLELTRENMAVGGRPLAINHIPASTIRVHRDGDRFQQRRGNKKRWFKRIGLQQDIDMDTGDLHAAGSVAPEKRGSEIIMLSTYSPRCDVYGVPEWIAAIGSIGGDVARAEYNRQFFQNFGVPAYAVFISGNFDPGEVNEETGATELEALIEEKFKEVAKNPYSTLTMILPSVGENNDIKVELKPLAVEIKEASFRLYRKDNRDEILAAHGVDPYRLGIAETGSLGGSAAQVATKIYKDSVIEPRQQTIEMLINKHIIEDGFGITGWRFEMAEIDTDDEKWELELHKELHAMGAMTASEIRSLWADRVGIDSEYRPTDTDLDQIDAALRAIKAKA